MRGLVRIFCAGPALAGAIVALTACGGGGGSGGSGVVVTELASAVVGAAGGAVTLSGSALAGTAVGIPAGALVAPATISISQVTGRTGLDPDVLITDIGTAGTTFVLPASVTVKYDPAYLTANGITDASTLKIVAMGNGVANETLVTTAQDDVNHLLTADITQVGRFAVLGYTNASLNGTYRVADFYYDSTAPHGIMPAVGSALPAPGGFTSDLLVLKFDGAGKFSLQGRQNRDGVATKVLQAGTYSVSADGTVSIGNLLGSVLAGGSMLVLQEATSGHDPQVIFGIKSGGGSFSKASLDGVYKVVDYYLAMDEPQSAAPAVGDVLPSPKGLTADVLAFAFDGAGNYTMTGTQNRDGIVTTVSRAGTYTVSSDGNVALDNMSGAMLAGGGGFVLASADGNPRAAIGVKADVAGAGSASLKGNYRVTTYRIKSSVIQTAAPSVGDPLPQIFGTNGMLMTMACDGAGSYNVATGVANNDGLLSSISFNGTYAVAPDGTLTFGNLTGQMLSGGSAFILATTSGDPWVVVGVLQ